MHPTRRELRMPRRSSSEFRAYPWIEGKLRERGWNTKNPNDSPKGQVWTQGECLLNEEIRRGLGGRKPENVVKATSNLLWTIEAKGLKAELAKALHEAKSYADDITDGSTVLGAPFATGVAGNEVDGYTVRTQYRSLAGAWQDLRFGQSPLDRLPSRQELLRIAANDSADLAAVPLSVSEVVELANFINKRLHIAKVEKDQRALLVAIVLLALEQDPTLALGQNPRIFLDDINSRAQGVFTATGRQALWDSIKIRPSNENLANQAAALNDIIEKLKAADILNSVRRTDVLGAFFESFLRYGNTSKDLGIVLTPRHLCWLAAESLEISAADRVYDPAAGTGGFLVAAFNRVKDIVDEHRAISFATNNLFGIEVSGKVAALAFVNMYFRGDGRHNLKIDSSLRYRLVATATTGTPTFEEGVERQAAEQPAITRVLMNPPFGLKAAKEQEPYFVDHALGQLVDRGLLYAVLPASIMYDREFTNWRKELLRTNTLLAVVASPIDIFYPVATETVNIFVRKGVPHDEEQDVLWGRITNDGFVKRKGFRVERPGVDYRTALRPLAKALQGWVVRGQAPVPVPGVIEMAPISYPELIPQAHLGVGQLAEVEFGQEVRTIYKSVTSQIWDQESKGPAQ